MEKKRHKLAFHRSYTQELYFRQTKSGNMIYLLVIEIYQIFCKSALLLLFQSILFQFILITAFKTKRETKPCCHSNTYQVSTADSWYFHSFVDITVLTILFTALL